MIAASKDITIKAADGGSFSAYMALPKTTPAPAIIIITSIFGTDQEMRDRTDRYAEAGFIGVVPDIFWRNESGPLSPNDEAERKRAYARLHAFDVDKGIADIKAIVDMLRSMKEYSGKFAVAGFCFGGRFTVLAATRLGAAAGVAFHGTNIDVPEAEKVACPLSLHFGDDDAAVPMDEVEAIKAALKRNPKAEIFVYPGAKHGFSSPSRPAYDPEAARLSHERAMKVLSGMK
ncbi:MAG TPA: dienelactone hydrolase family protein [Candidatus Binatia bacterium]|nr:dienelactone hydrolase family protein [Candidatus Binatia bacterium]